jgi:hypothetical protein
VTAHKGDFEIIKKEGRKETKNSNKYVDMFVVIRSRLLKGPY